MTDSKCVRVLIAVVMSLDGVIPRRVAETKNRRQKKNNKQTAIMAVKFKYTYIFSIGTLAEVLDASQTNPPSSQQNPVATNWI